GSAEHILNALRSFLGPVGGFGRGIVPLLLMGWILIDAAGGQWDSLKRKKTLVWAQTINLHISPGLHFNPHQMLGDLYWIVLGCLSKDLPRNSKKSPPQYCLQTSSLKDTPTQEAPGLDIVRKSNWEQCCMPPR
ncbi:hypothetical protein DSO57_1039143, partial [Entomophthora muscae]